jgi:hypothetical protein
MAVVLQPALWWTGLVQLTVLAAPGWWRRWPPLPLPDPAYLRFRLQTAYGDPARQPEPADVVGYLKWCRSMRGLAR